MPKPRIKALPDVPRWAALAAHAVPLVVLPSSLWRVALVAGAPVAPADQLPDGLPLSAYILSLSVVSEALAFLTLGLVRAWGEVVPGWIPVLGGRRVRPLAAVAPAVFGVTALTALVGWFCYAAYADLGGGAQVTDTPLQSAVLTVCYVPLIAWPVLLAAVTVAYYRRRVSAPGRAPLDAAPGRLR
ncbi:hypothetical protein ACQB60_15215 [Actinomycetota bacterium Odt1-20B]